MLICPALQLQLIDQIETCESSSIQIDKYIISIIIFWNNKIIGYQFADCQCLPLKKNFGQVMQIFNWLIKIRGLEGATINHVGHIV